MAHVNLIGEKAGEQDVEQEDDTNGYPAAAATPAPINAAEDKIWHHANDAPDNDQKYRRPDWVLTGGEITAFAGKEEPFGQKADQRADYPNQAPVKESKEYPENCPKYGIDKKHHAGITGCGHVED